jgi:hypothetical protein
VTCCLWSYHDAELLVQLAHKRVQLRLASFDDSAWQVPDVRVRVLVGASMAQEDLAVSDQGADHDLNHSQIEPCALA